VNAESSGEMLDATLRGFMAGQKLFGRYTLIKTLGRGGMGVVWLAHDELLDRDVALKFLPELIIHDRAILEDLKRETKRSLELTHKNIVRIHDFVHDVISGCISMEYIEGDTLSNLRADRPTKIFEPEELKPWLSQLCDALDYAHNQARIIHRDLKPANLMVSKRGQLKVSDFGIARSISDSVSRVTMERGTSGTLVYMSPQQLDGERGTHLDDIYSVGATIYELITSKPPFYSGDINRQIHDRTAPSMMQRRRDLEIEGSPIPRNWEEVVAACLAKDPARRPQAVADLADGLELTSRQIGKVATLPVKRSKRKAIITATICLLVAVGWYFGIYRPTQDRQSRFSPPAATETSPIEGSASQSSQQESVAAQGEVTVNTSPSGASVTLDDMTKQSPANFTGLHAGKYPMSIRQRGYETIEKEVEVKEKQSLDLGTITLQRDKSATRLTIMPSGT
jgi:serine/threonine protein kinase